LGRTIDAGPLSRTMLRLRHDLVIVGRATAAPLPDAVGQRLAPCTIAVGAEAGRYLAACADALRTRRAPPDPREVGLAIATFTAEVAALRADGLTRPLSTAQLEQLFALGFAFEEMRRNLLDLQRCI